MSDIPESPNSPKQIKLRQAAAIIRMAQELKPYLDDTRNLAQETADVVKVYGTVTDEDLAELGISAATLTGLVSFMNQLVAYYDKTEAGRETYRTMVNSVSRVGAQL